MTAMHGLTRLLYHVALATSLWGFSANLLAATTLQNDVIVHQHKSASDQIRLDVRLRDGASISQVNARVAGIPVPMSDSASYPANQQTSAILFLVDTSDPNRQQAVQQAAEHIQQTISLAASHLRFGLARFDTNLHLITPMGSNPQQVVSAARQLKAVGRTTELYRNTLGAIKVLARYPADRKFLFMLSDGLAEDRAYFHRDVVQAATQNDVSIYTIGYAGTISNTVALQTLRRLSEDTGGRFLQSKPGSFQLDELALNEALRDMDSGIQLTANFSDAVAAGIGGKQQIDMAIDADSGSLLISMPVKLPEIRVINLSSSRPTTTITTAGNEQPGQSVIIQQVPVTSGAESGVGSYAIWMLIALSIILLALMAFIASRLRRGAGAADPAPLAESTEEPYAWLERIDGNHTERFPINSNQVKIGRFRGNDIKLHDAAVSRYHAEIRFTDGGEFIVADVGSKNGLIVNSEEIYEQVLHDQDIIEIGDIRLRFSIHSDFASDMQNTVMFKTQIPAPSTTNH